MIKFNKKNFNIKFSSDLFILYFPKIYLSWAAFLPFPRPPRNVLPVFMWYFV